LDQFSRPDYLHLKNYTSICWSQFEDKKEKAKMILSGKIKMVSSTVDFGEVERRVQAVQERDVFTGELIQK
jgi:hypothetical protein